MMRQIIIYHIATLIASSTVCSICAYPLSQPADSQDITKTSLTNGKEIDVLMLGIKDQKELIADRNKRTIGLLRELFPDITKEINIQINRLVNNVVQRLGPFILGTVLNPELERNALKKPIVDADEYDISMQIVKDYDNLPKELINFEPDTDYISQNHAT